jgi:hypothetical protein
MCKKRMKAKIFFSILRYFIIFMFLTILIYIDYLIQSEVSGIYVN